MSPPEWRVLKRTEPTKAHETRMEATKRFFAGLKTIKI